MDTNLSMQPRSSWRRAASCCAGALVVVLAASHALAQTVLLEWRGVAQQPADQFGWAMAGVGDVDGDGIPDVAIGAPYTRIGTLQYAGRLYVHSGSDGRQLFALDGWMENSEFGRRVTVAGDVDRDGFADILAGDVMGTHVVSGRTGAVIQFHPGLTAYVGDLDGDAWSDLLLSTRHPSLFFAGGADLISGRTGDVLQRWSGSYPQESFGSLLSSAGDIDGDSVPDLLIGAVGALGTGGNGFWVYSGRTFGLLLRVPPISATFPRALIGLGDVDGDGLDDIGVGDSGYLNSIYRVSVYGSGGATPLFTLASTTLRLGSVVAAVGDLDGDGYDDVLTSGGQANGGARIFSGRDQSQLVHIAPGPLDSNYNCAGVGDVDGDDFPDFLSGPFYVAGVAAVRLFSGAPRGVTTLGSGCAGASGQVPRIGCTYVPARGSPFRINLSRVRPGASAFLAMGISTTSWNGVPLPTDLTALGMPGCLLLTAPDSVAAATTSGPAGKGRAHHAMAIPATPSLQNATFHAQWFVLEPPGAATVATSTRALQIRIQ